MPDSVPLHRLQQGDGVGDVVAVVGERFLDRFTDQRPGGEVHDRLDGILAENPVQNSRITQVTLHEVAAGHHFAVAAREVVQDDDRVIGPQQVEHHVRTDVAGAADNQYGRFTHVNISPNSGVSRVRRAHQEL